VCHEAATEEESWDLVQQIRRVDGIRSLGIGTEKETIEHRILQERQDTTTRRCLYDAGIIK